jgi:hypothetical protein
MKQLIRKFRQARRGVAALEFVMLMPIYLMALLAMVEAYQYFRTAGIMDRIAYSVGNLVAEKAFLIDNNSGTDSNDVGIFWTVAPQMALPLDFKTQGSVIITVVKDAGGSAPSPVIAWQRQSTWGTGDASRISGASPLPGGFPFLSNDNTVIIEVFYHFNPFNAARTFWPAAPTSQTLYRRVYFRPRFQNIDTLQAK